MKAFDDERNPNPSNPLNPSVAGSNQEKRGRSNLDEIESKGPLNQKHFESVLLLKYWVKRLRGNFL